MTTRTSPIPAATTQCPSKRSPLPVGEGRGEGNAAAPEAEKLLARSRKLRRRSSNAEKMLWRHLRDRRLNGYKFRRQVVMDPYIVDFLCLEKMLIIEADGGHHMEQAGRDLERTMQLELLGYKVLRFWNHEILGDTEAVLNRIAAVLEEPPHPGPLPRGEGAESMIG